MRRLRAGILGGGAGAFIGSVHRIAAELDGQAQVVAGVLSSHAEKARQSAEAWGLDRSYADFREMARAERARADGVDFIIIAAPNHLHHPMAEAFLEAGIHVVCDKPLAFTVAQAKDLVNRAESGRLVFALTHNYTGYPAVRQARAMVRQGLLGDIRKVLVEYQQQWLSCPLEAEGNKQAMWRTDPARVGLSCCVGDIGTHAENLLEFITGRRILSLCADLTSFVPGRRLDDDANILLRLEGGGKGVLTCSQVAAGEENNLNIRIYGSRAGLEWRQQQPDTLIHKPLNRPWEHWNRGMDYMGEDAKASTRTPFGHPEGYLEAFATIYKEAIADIRRAQDGLDLKGGYPTARDGLRGMRFVERVVESSEQGSVWVEI